jgi:hypothetical protein
LVVVSKVCLKKELHKNQQYTCCYNLLTLSLLDEGCSNIKTLSLLDEGCSNLLTLSLLDEGCYNLLTLSLLDKGCYNPLTLIFTMHSRSTEANSLLKFHDDNDCWHVWMEQFTFPMKHTKNSVHLSNI